MSGGLVAEQSGETMLSNKVFDDFFVILLEVLGRVH